MPSPRIALVDGNSFYCSCERVINPAYINQPLVVLSNNDGCVIARTKEAKALGIAMAEPWFKVKHLQASHGLIARSANFDLYGDLSDRMMNIIGQFAPKQEIYSIDECFIDLNDISASGRQIGTAIRQRVLKWLGLPTSIGIGTSKTLAKLANHLAKDIPRLNGICDLSQLSRAQLIKAISHVPVHEVWGIGRGLRPKLQAMGIFTAADLANTDFNLLQQRFSVVLERTARELNGQSCISLDNMPADKQQIMCSRSFGHKTSSKNDLSQAIATFANIASHKLRKQNSCTSNVLVFIRTNKHRPSKQYSASTIVKITQPTNNSHTIIKAALNGLNYIYKNGYQYAKAGVCLLDLSNKQALGEQLNLFNQYDTHKKSDLLMQTIDHINHRFGSNTLTSASTISPIGSPWHMHQTSLSPACTTRWDQILNVNA